MLSSCYVSGIDPYYVTPSVGLYVPPVTYNTYIPTYRHNYEPSYGVVNNYYNRTSYNRYYRRSYTPSYDRHCRRNRH